MALTDLPWLPSPPDRFRSLCKDAAGHEGAIRMLAGHSLDMNQLEVLSKTISRLPADDPALNGLTPVTLALLGNGTTSLMAPALVASAARHGILLTVREAPYDQAMQWVLDPGSDIHSSPVDVALLAFDHRILPEPENMADPGAAESAVEDASGLVEGIADALNASGDTSVVFQTLPPPGQRPLGSFDRLLPGSPNSMARAWNERIARRVSANSGEYILDVEALAQTIGYENWHDPNMWHIAKLAFSQHALPLYAEHAARLLGALRGKSRKCLVLDLDNTLWGGVVGDDGTEGLVLGQGDPSGEAFLDVQQTALTLKRHGVILAVSSKNEDEIARQPFRDHPDMVLKEADIALFQANWSDKATNLEAIADALDIGLDTLVLLDDNPAERAQVRQALPMVAAPELPDDPAGYADMLLQGGYFETIGLSNEDLLRADDYAARAKRVQLQGQARDMDSYLRSLDMQIEFAAFDRTGRARIAQLINKSNQFNLTTRRYTEAEIEAMETDDAVHTLQVRLRDRFGDNGMISVVICRADGSSWDIDTWLMSCRVLGRGVEQAVLTEIVDRAASAGISRLCGRYIPTERNGLVRDHYARLGFTQSDDRWILEVEDFERPTVFMTIKRKADSTT